MRCFACDRINASYFDGPTGRQYCNSCINAVWDACGKNNTDLTEAEKSVTLEELVEEEWEVMDAVEEYLNTSDVS